MYTFYKVLFFNNHVTEHIIYVLDIYQVKNCCEVINVFLVCNSCSVTDPFILVGWERKLQNAVYRELHM